MPALRIDDADDPRLTDYRNVPDAELVARGGLFVAEGRLVVRRLLTDSRLVVRSVMVTRPAFGSLNDVLAARPEPCVYVVPQDVMNAITGFNMHRGCLAIGERPAALDWRELAARSRTLVAMERVANADNVGSTFRNAAAFGVDGVLLGPACADPLYRKAIRTSIGTALTLPFADAAPWPEVLLDLQRDGWATVALTPSAGARPLREVAAATAGARVVVAVGHEGDGLCAGTLDACGHHARIPMAASVDSVNVATAAAIALYEMRASTP